MTQVSVAPPRRRVDVQVDGQTCTVGDDATILDAARRLNIDIPALCYLETLGPIDACRACVVELDGSRTLVPACSRRVEAGMVIKTDSERVRHSRRLVLELLVSSVDLTLASADIRRWLDDYEVREDRFGPAAPPAAAGDRERHRPGHHDVPIGTAAETVAQPPKIDNDLYVRDYALCILCYRCVEACGVEAQNTFAIAVAGRGFDARISTEFDVSLPSSACVYCGNCIGVCPTGALMAKSEYDLRQAGRWDDSLQEVTRTVCPFCGVGCNLELHVQDNTIVKVTSPLDHDVTSGHLCIKGRFGWEHVQNRPEP